MNRKLTLLLPLALLAACSQTPAPAGTGGDDVAPAAAKAATSRRWRTWTRSACRASTGCCSRPLPPTASASTRCSPAKTSRSPWTSLMAACRSATPATTWVAATPWPTAS